jgi:tRNA A-37 threonylcarbamoyl transferase component Bud32
VNEAPGMAAADAAVVAAWWQHFVAHGRLPDDLPLVQGRLIRTVHRGTLPSGPVHVKAMTFPRLKDRLRYLLRPLPAAHEARLLAAVLAAGLPAPAVLAVRTARHRWLPARSLLVLRTLPVIAETRPPAQRLADEAALVVRLLAAGIVHRDLHGENFVRLASGELAVLDLQSAGVVRRATTAQRLAAAARLLRDRQADPEAGASLLGAGLLQSAAERDAVVARAAAEQAWHARGRLLRCFRESTEFQVRVSLRGREYRLRGAQAPGRWWWGDRSLRAAWLGQRARQLATGVPPVFAAYFQNWWWLGGGAGLYVPAACSEAWIQEQVRAARDWIVAPEPRS